MFGGGVAQHLLGLDDEIAQVFEEFGGRLAGVRIFHDGVYDESWVDGLRKRVGKVDGTGVSILRAGLIRF